MIPIIISITLFIKHSKNPKINKRSNKFEGISYEAVFGSTR